MQTKIRALILENAIKFKGKANPKAIIGKLLSSHPEQKNNLKELSNLIQEITEEINSLTIEQQKQELEAIGTTEKKTKTSKEFKLKNPKNPILRFAPNPNGYLSLGHCRPAYWNYFLAKKHKGKFLVRFDDTDPKNKIPLKQAYKEIEDDLNWLNLKPDKIIIQSKRLKTYYKYAEKLLKNKQAYICTCNPETKRKLLTKKQPCSCRTKKDNLEEWKKMFSHYKEGQAILRIKTDLENKNPAVRDFPAFRIVNNSKHPLDKKSKVWPLLNFASAIDDHKFKITHIIRGIDLKISDDRQKYIYKYLNWKYPETEYHGKLLVKGIKSTSEAKKLIDQKKLLGWDDPRLGTIKALRKKGFQPQTIINFIKNARLTKTDVEVSIEKLNAENRAIIEPIANRYFFIETPKKIKILNAPKTTTKIHLHPDFKNRGSRIFKTSDEFLIEEKIKKNQIYRLMHLFNFKNKEFLSKEYDPNLKAKLIHWLPNEKDLVKTEILMLNATIKKGLAEAEIKKLKANSIIQFERFGFVRLDKIEKGIFKFVFTHK